MYPGLEWWGLAVVVCVGSLAFGLGFSFGSRIANAKWQWWVDRYLRPALPLDPGQDLGDHLTDLPHRILPRDPISSDDKVLPMPERVHLKRRGQFQC